MRRVMFLGLYPMGDSAEFPDDIADSRLWFDGESFCHCGRRWWHSPHETDDIKWCTTCAGIIEQATE